MRSLRWALGFVAVAGVATGLLALSIVLGSDRYPHGTLDAVLRLVVGWSFIGAGLFAWWRRPHNRVGMLLAAVGFAWFVTEFAYSDKPWIFITGVVLGNLPIVVLAHLIMSFPSGRLENRTARWLIVIGYLDAVGLALASMLVLERPIPEMRCFGCADNPIALTHWPEIFKILNSISAIGGVVLITTMVVLSVRRWMRLTGPARASVTPVMFTGGLTLALLAVTIAISQVNGDDGSGGGTIDVITMVFVAAVPYAFLFGLLRTRFSNASAVGELIEMLSDGGRQYRDIRDALAAALGDRSLEFAYWLPERNAYVDSSGSPVDVPADGGERAHTPVEHDGELVATIIYDSSAEGRDQLVRSAAAAAGMALRNQRLEAQLRANLAELHASRARIVRAESDARRRLERDLHDGAQQHLVSLALKLRLARSQVEADPPAAVELIDEAAVELATATEDLRELARGIHPAILTDRGLAPALESLVRRAPVPVEVTELPATRLPDEIESTIFFVVAEALTNIARYAAASEAELRVALADGAVTVLVRDNGAGGADPMAGSGIRGLVDRVAALDGRLTIVSPAGQGTTVTAEIPCAS